MLDSIAKPKPRRPDLHTEVATVTPEIAAAWLDQNTQNRKVARLHVRKMARDMASGAWRLTGDAIRFAVSGRLLDGQHRLLACIEAGVPFTTVVLYGLPDDAQQYIDLGKSRSAADHLSMSGYANSTAVQAAARLLLAWKHGATHIHGGLSGNFSVHEVLEMVQRHPALPASVRESLGSAGISATTVAALHYAGTHLLGHPDRATAMIHVVRAGVPDYPDDPLHKLRERMLRARTDTTKLIRRWQQPLYVITAWNAFVQRKPLAVLRLPDKVSVTGLDLKML